MTAFAVDSVSTGTVVASCLTVESEHTGRFRLATQAATSNLQLDSSALEHMDGIDIAAVGQAVVDDESDRNGRVLAHMAMSVADDRS